MATNQAPTSYKDPYWTELASNTETKLGLPSGLLASVVTKGERSNNDQVSEAGAKTPFQIIPSTRKAVLDKYGVDAYLSPDNAAEAAGLLLKESLARNKGDQVAAQTEPIGVHALARMLRESLADSRPCQASPQTFLPVQAHSSVRWPTNKRHSRLGRQSLLFTKPTSPAK